MYENVGVVAELGDKSIPFCPIEPFDLADFSLGDRCC
jgi:hypothetical protein